MAKTINAFIKAEQRTLLRRIDVLTNRFNNFDNPVFLLNTPVRELTSRVRRFKRDLSFAVESFIRGEAPRRAIKAALTEFRKKVPGSRKISSLLRLLFLRRRVIRQVSRQMKAVINELSGRLDTKVRTFHLLMDSQRPRTLAERNRLTDPIGINGRVFSQKTIQEGFNLMQRRFGRFDSVLFRNGAHFPLKAFMKQKSITLSNEAHRLATAIESNKNKVLTARISKHNATDSCRVHEGRIVFISSEAKREFKRLTGRAPRWPTLAEVEDDRTHMFKPNCKHILVPLPLDGLSKKRISTVITQNPAATRKEVASV